MMEIITFRINVGNLNDSVVQMLKSASEKVYELEGYDVAMDTVEINDASAFYRTYAAGKYFHTTLKLRSEV